MDRGVHAVRRRSRRSPAPRAGKQGRPHESGRGEPRRTGPRRPLGRRQPDRRGIRIRDEPAHRSRAVLRSDATARVRPQLGACDTPGCRLHRTDLEQRGPRSLHVHHDDGNPVRAGQRRRSRGFPQGNHSHLVKEPA